MAEPPDSKTGRVMGIDYGLRRIGIALSDPGWALATPLTTLIRRRGKRPPIGAIVSLIQEHGVGRIVVGIPLERDGSSPEWTDEVRRFASTLAQRGGRPVSTQDEGYSSAEAESRLQSIGLPRRKRLDKGRIDAAAAAIILQDWLDEHSDG